MDQPTSHNPVDLLFGGMEKLGPGDNAHTAEVLRRLPKQDYSLVVDAGCGTGRQTLVLARELQTLVHAIDSHPPFLAELAARANSAELAHLVQTHEMDMKDIPERFQDVELLWSEGAAYNIGFVNALSTWRCSLSSTGFLVVSELSWLHEEIPEAAKEFFETGYPDMQSVARNITAAENAGYRVLGTHVLPREAWTKGYYDVLAPRAAALAKHPDPTVREFATETTREIEVFEKSENSYGFYTLQRC